MVKDEKRQKEDSGSMCYGVSRSESGRDGGRYVLKLRRGGTSILKLLRSQCGEGYVDVAVLVLCVMLVIAVGVSVLPVFISKNKLDIYASELCREAEVAGGVGTETTRRAQILTEQTGLKPDISWSQTGKIQLNEEFTVTLTLQTDIGIFGGFGSFPITLAAKSSGKSEVYWK